ncbi:hypothetical protein B0A48_15625 [Cryoendolithus antarcticus]|uniref:F-box domain-containing protein n=1 Tax=Cryoendolithus antarcticus TaxID=1507870 RepID=A0A1V8SGT0_9PEZI|nr:hypothetical protein B0A48_15625 [Cryoendolithus antarcticus]
MAGTSNLLSLPGELRNRIYESIHLLEGIEVIRGRTRLHPLSYTCRQLRLEITSHKAAYATSDAAIDIRTWVFDFDFSNTSKWLEQHPCVGSEVEPRFLKLHLYDSYEIHMPTIERRLQQMERNMETWKVGKWSAENFKQENAAGKNNPAMPRYLDLVDYRTKYQYIVRISTKLLEPDHYCTCWPKPREATAKMPESFQRRFGHPRRDFMARIRQVVFRRYRPGIQAEWDLDACNHVLWSCTAGGAMPCGCVVDPLNYGCKCTTEVQGRDSEVSLLYDAQRHYVYDRDLLVALKSAEVRYTRLADLEEYSSPGLASCFKDRWSGTRKRIAADDTRGERKKRAINVAGMSIEGEWRAKVAAELKWDDAMDIDILSDGLTSMELEQATAED